MSDEDFEKFLEEIGGVENGSSPIDLQLQKEELSELVMAGWESSKRC